MKTTKLLLLLLLLLCVISFNTVLAQENSERNDSYTVEKTYLELSKIEVIPIKDTKTDRQYELYVKLPEGYSENSEIKYPVIYYTDAMWHVEILSGAAEYIMEEAILVGISWQKDIDEDLMKERGAHVSRFRDYSVIKSSNAEHQAKYQFGQASNHLDFIRNGVIKYVEANYKTDPSNRTYFGYSLSGEFGAYILLSQPDTFKNYILGSPSFGRDIPYFSDLASNTRQIHSRLNANVFISYGSLEKELGEHAEEFITLLKNRNDQSLSVLPVVIEGSHQTAFPMTGVRSIEWLSKMNDFPVLEGPYFGQKPPGMTAEIFAPGIISINGRYEHGISFSPDLDELYFSANKKGGLTDIYFSKLEGKKWKPVKKAKFTKGEKDEEMHPFVSPDGKKIYFVALNADNTDVKIWYVDRLEDSWSNARRLDSPINNNKVFYPNQAKNGDFFYTNISDIRNIKIQNAFNKNGRFPGVQEVNIEFGVHAFIAPSQDFLLVNARNNEDETRKDNDIYVCFKKKDETWTKPINLGKSVNSTFGETCPSITPDGKYLFFGRYNEEGGLSNFYWVDAEVINTVRPANL